MTRILRDELNDRPDDPFVLFNLGAIAIERQDWREALDYLRRSLARLGADRLDHAEAVRPDRPGPPDARRPGGGLAVCAEGLSLDPDDAELLVPQGGGAPASGRVGRGGAVLAADPASAVPSSSPASIRGSTAT